MMNKILTTFILIIISSFTANARWMEPEESPVSISEDIETSVFKDGSSETLALTKIKILKESAKDEYGMYRLRYNNTSESLEVLEAKSITNGIEHVIEKSNIQDEKVASSINDAGFDSKSQILISFTNLEVGSELIIKTKHKIKISFLKDFFSDPVFFGDKEFTTYKQVLIKSEIPLYSQINDKLGVLDYIESKSEGMHKYQIKLKKGLIQDLSFETGNSFIPHDEYTWVHFSSSKDWQDFGAKMFGGYVKAASDGLPDLHLNIANEAKKIENEIDRLNFITSELNRKITYFGDWQTVDGGYFPRMLNKVAKTRLGDCKDFSSSLSAILNHIGGYDVAFVFVNRGQGFQSFSYKNPNMNSHNHVMIKAKSLRTDQIFWIDPTNRVSMAQGIFPDVAGKDVFVIHATESKLDRIPEIDPNHSQINVNSIGTQSNDNTLKYKSSFEFLGESSFGLTGLGLSFNKNEIQDYIYNYFFKKPVPIKNQLNSDIPDLTLREVKDLTVSLEFLKDDSLIKTNLGQAYLMEKANITTLLDFDEAFVGTIYIGEPVSSKLKDTIKDFKINNKNKIDFEISSPWLKASRKVSSSGSDTIITEEYSILKKFISHQDRQTPEFKKLKTELKNNFGDVALIKNN